jgi:hypothetical protein
MEPDRGVTNVRKLNMPHWKRRFGIAHRCLVPVTSFEEPDPASQVEGGNVPNAWFAYDEEKSLMFFAGIHVPQWKSVRKVKDGLTTDDLYGFLTTDSNALVKPIIKRRCLCFCSHPRKPTSICGRRGTRRCTWRDRYPTTRSSYRLASHTAHRSFQKMASQCVRPCFCDRDSARLDSHRLTLADNVLILFFSIGKDMDMSWLKLDPELSSIPEPKFRLAVQDHFLKLFWPHHDSSDWDVAAFYRSRDEQPTYYFSPGAAHLLMRFNEYPYEPCDRPDSSAVTLQIGSSLAVDTAWVEFSDETRSYPELEQEFEDADADFWAELMGSGGKHGSNGSDSA